MNDINPTGLLFSMVLIQSIKRSKKKLKTFFLSIAVVMGVNLVALFPILFLPASNDGALGHLAADTGRIAGTMAALFYSRKTREDAPRSVYLFAMSFTLSSIVWLVLEKF